MVSGGKSLQLSLFLKRSNSTIPTNMASTNTKALSLPEAIVTSALAAVQAAQAGDVVVARSREDIHKWIAAIATADDEGAELDQ